MEQARVTNPESGRYQDMSADHFEQDIAGSKLLKLTGNPKFKAMVSLTDIVTGFPVRFVNTYKRGGFEKHVCAHFAFAAGYSPEKINPKAYTSVSKAVDNGAQILLSINLDTSHRKLNLRSMKEDNALSIEEWKAQHRGNYLSVSVKSVQDAVRVIQQVDALGANIDDTIHVSYRGAVLPYRQFYLGRRENDITKLYDDLSDDRSGVKASGEERFIGFPRMMRFVINDKTLRTRGSQNIVDTDIILPNGKKMIMNLGLPHLPRQPGSDKSAYLSNVWDKVAEFQGEFYVLACPSITTGRHADKKKWQSMRFKIVEPEIQMRGVKDHPNPKFTPQQFGALAAA